MSAKAANLDNRVVDFLVFMQSSNFCENLQRDRSKGDQKNSGPKWKLFPSSRLSGKECLEVDAIILAKVTMLVGERAESSSQPAPIH